MVTTFFVTLMNCDLKVYSHIPYKPLKDCHHMQKEPYKIIILCKNKGNNCLNLLYDLI